MSACPHLAVLLIGHESYDYEDKEKKTTIWDSELLVALLDEYSQNDTYRTSAYTIELVRKDKLAIKREFVAVPIEIL